MGRVQQFMQRLQALFSKVTLHHCARLQPIRDPTGSDEDFQRCMKCLLDHPQFEFRKDLVQELVNCKSANPNEVLVLGGTNEILVAR